MTDAISVRQKTRASAPPSEPTRFMPSSKLRRTTRRACLGDTALELLVATEIDLARRLVVDPQATRDQSLGLADVCPPHEECQRRVEHCSSPWKRRRSGTCAVELEHQACNEGQDQKRHYRDDPRVGDRRTPDLLWLKRPCPGPIRTAEKRRPPWNTHRTHLQLSTARAASSGTEPINGEADSPEEEATERSALADSLRSVRIRTRVVGGETGHAVEQTGGPHGTAPGLVDT
jgi:hypothetical protein